MLYGWRTKHIMGWGSNLYVMIAVWQAVQATHRPTYGAWSQRKERRHGNSRGCL